MLLNSVADFKSLIEPVVADVHGHTKPLCFRFLRSRSGHAEFHYRYKSDDKWLPEEKGIQLLTVGTNTIASISFTLYTQAFPDISSLETVIPSLSKLDVDRLRRDFPKYYPFLQAQSKSHWDNFFEHQLVSLTSESNPSQYHFDFRQLVKAGVNCSITAVPPSSPTVVNESISGTQEVNINVYSTHAW